MIYTIKSIFALIKFGFPFTLFAFALYFIIRIILLIINKSKIDIKKEIITILFIIYLSFLLSLTIFPRIGTVKGLNLIPFKIIYDSIIEFKNNNISYFIISFLGNIILFIPYGILLKSKGLNNLKIIIYGFFLTIFIEFVQLFQNRWVDIDDLLLNVLGVYIGLIIYNIINYFKLKKK